MKIKTCFSIVKCCCAFWSSISNWRCIYINCHLAKCTIFVNLHSCCFCVYPSFKIMVDWYHLVEAKLFIADHWEIESC